jgi:hypothetical protein
MVNQQRLGRCLISRVNSLLRMSLLEGILIRCDLNPIDFIVKGYKCLNMSKTLSNLIKRDNYLKTISKALIIYKWKNQS